MGRLQQMLTPFTQLRRDVDRIFEEVPSIEFGAFPALNVWDYDDQAFIEAELPGVEPGGVDVSVAGSDVTISGQRKADEPAGYSWHRRERVAGSFSRTVSLPWEIDAEHVEAKLSNGVLTVRLPKAASSKPKKVKVLSA
jgi:HSP20 family protein